MKTNFQMLRQLDEFQPKEFGIISEQEVKLIKETLCLEEMDELALRNLRDFTVLYCNCQIDDSDLQDERAIIDKMSAVTYVIDSELFMKGCEV